MDGGNDTPRLIAAIKMRLELDSGLGVEYAALRDGDASKLARIVRGSAERRTPAPAADPPRRPAFEPRRSASAAAPASPPREPAATPGRTIAPAASSLVPPAEPPPSPEKEAAIEGLRLEAMRCRKCGLCERRSTVVWGEGGLDARVMFIGEGPGRDEDEQGRPFVGRSGRLLTDIIEKGMRVPRAMTYITNVVKCRPPGNREPKPEEVEACSRYLHRQVEVIRPEIIVAVGGVAGCALLGLPPKTSGLRGKWHSYWGTPLRVVFHPSYLLRQRRSADDRTTADRETWNDIQEVMARLAET